MIGRFKNKRGTDRNQIDPMDDIKHLKRDLAEKSVRGGVSTAVSEISCNIFRLVGTVVLARLLMPEHFGLVSMVTALTALVEMFKDFGLAVATIQRSQITQEQVSTLFWINTGLGTLITLLIAGAAPIIAWFYGDTRLLWISLALSSVFFFGGLTVQHQALLRRQMRFARLAYIQAFATALSFLISIILAWQGFEYWALVWKELTRAIFVAIGTWLLCHWLPGLPKFTSGIGLMLRTGQHVTGFNIVYFFSRNLDQILLGRFWGPEPVGLYRQAGQLLLLPISLISFPLTYVMTPALSALQGEPERYCRYYKKVVAFLSFCYMPVIACLAIFAESFTGLILGQKWIAASSILRVLALATFIESVTGTCGIVMVTHGRTKAYFYWGVIHAVCLCVAFCIGVNWGPSGVAVAYVACTYATLLPLLWVSFKDTPISISVFFEAISLPILSSVIMGLLLIMIRYIFKPVNALEELGFSLLIAPPLYFGAWAFIPGGKQKLIEHFSYLRLAIESLPFFSVVKKS